MTPSSKIFHPPTSRATANLLPTILLPSTTRTPRLSLYQSSSISCSYPAETAVSPSTAVIDVFTSRLERGPTWPSFDCRRRGRRPLRLHSTAGELPLRPPARVGADVGVDAGAGADLPLPRPAIPPCLHRPPAYKPPSPAPARTRAGAGANAGGRGCGRGRDRTRARASFVLTPSPVNPFPPSSRGCGPRPPPPAGDRRCTSPVSVTAGASVDAGADLPP